MLITTNVLSKLQRTLRSGAKTTGLDKSVESLELCTLGYKPLEDGELSKSGVLSVMDAVERYSTYNLILPPASPIWDRNMDAGLRYVGIFVDGDEFTLISANPSNVCYAAFRGKIHNPDRIFDGVFYAAVSRETCVSLSSVNTIVSKGSYSLHLISVAKGPGVEFSLVMRAKATLDQLSGKEASNG